jgi:hypothetical protein
MDPITSPATAGAKRIATPFCSAEQSPYWKLPSGEIIAYGYKWPAGTPLGTIELWMFAHCEEIAAGKPKVDVNQKGLAEFQAHSANQRRFSSKQRATQSDRQLLQISGQEMAKRQTLRSWTTHDGRT